MEYNDSWYVNNGNFKSAWKIVRIMNRYGLDDFDGYTFGSIIKRVTCSYQLHLGQQVHSMNVKMGYVENVYSCSALFWTCVRVEDVYVVFQSLPERNSIFMHNWVIVRLYGEGRCQN